MSRPGSHQPPVALQLQVRIKYRGKLSSPVARGGFTGPTPQVAGPPHWTAWVENVPSTTQGSVQGAALEVDRRIRPVSSRTGLPPPSAEPPGWPPGSQDNLWAWVLLLATLIPVLSSSVPLGCPAPCQHQPSVRGPSGLLSLCPSETRGRAVSFRKESSGLAVSARAPGQLCPPRSALSDRGGWPLAAGCKGQGRGSALPRSAPGG